MKIYRIAETIPEDNPEDKTDKRTTKDFNDLQFSDLSREKEFGSELPFEEIPLTSTPAFKGWFGNSKVVDAKGEPLAVYHGTPADFGAFNTDAENQLGSHFSEPRDVSEEFLTKEKGRIITAYLSLQNPYEMISDLGDWSDMGMLEEYLAEENGGPFTDEEFAKFNTPQNVQGGLHGKGYDGIFYINNFEGDRNSRAWIAFFPDQIRQY